METGREVLETPRAGEINVLSGTISDTKAHNPVQAESIPDCSRLDLAPEQEEDLDHDHGASAGGASAGVADCRAPAGAARSQSNLPRMAARIEGAAHRIRAAVR
jgi:hypothetical protein